MKRNLITLAAVLAIVSGGFIVAHAQSNSASAPANAGANPNPNPKPNAAGPGSPGLGHGGSFAHRMPGNSPMMFERFTEKLDLTPEQKAKIQPIFDQAKPQIQQIHEEAMQKMRTVMESTTAQIRALLTPEQATKLDEMKQAHEKMRDSMLQMHDANGE